MCAPALAELATGDERRALLDQTDDDVLTETKILRDQLRWAEGRPAATREHAALWVPYLRRCHPPHRARP